MHFTEPHPSAYSTRLEKEKWMLDLNTAIQAAKSNGSDVSLEVLCTHTPSKSWPRPSGDSTSSSFSSHTWP